jgi:hypothetical protein
VDYPEVDTSWKCFGFALSFNQCNLDCGTNLETLRDFTSVSSDFYPELGWHYGEAIEEWYLTQEQAIEDTRIFQSKCRLQLGKRFTGSKRVTHDVSSIQAAKKRTLRQTSSVVR